MNIFFKVIREIRRKLKGGATMPEYDFMVRYLENDKQKEKTFDKWAGVLKFLSNLKITHVFTSTINPDIEIYRIKRP